MSATPRNICVIVDTCQWILGRMGLAVAEYLPEDRVRVLPHWSLRGGSQAVKNTLEQADIIHFICSFAYREFRDADWAKQAAAIGSLHHIDESVEGLVEQLRDCDAAMVTSCQWERHMLDDGFPREQLFRVSYGVETNRFTPVEDRAALRAKHGIPNNAFVFGFFAKKSPPLSRKGADVFIEAVRLLAQRCDRSHVLIVGPGWQDEVADMRAAGIGVTYFPFLSARQMPLAYQLLDVYVCASRIEGGPVPVLESLSSGVPVISTRVGMVEQVVIPEETGFLVDFGATDQIADALARLESDPELTAKMGTAGRRMICEQYEWRHIREPVQILYAAAQEAAAKRDLPAPAAPWSAHEVARRNARMVHVDAIRFAAMQLGRRNVRGAARIFFTWLTSGPQSFVRRCLALPSGTAVVLAHFVNR
jgi:glycosyltransferase involved in cell wall biosynthesis